MELISVDFVQSPEETTRRHIAFRYNLMKARDAAAAAQQRSSSAALGGRDGERADVMALMRADAHAGPAEQAGRDHAARAPQEPEPPAADPGQCTRDASRLPRAYVNTLLTWWWPVCRRAPRPSRALRPPRRRSRAASDEGQCAVARCGRVMIVKHFFCFSRLACARTVVP